ADDGERPFDKVIPLFVTSVPPPTMDTLLPAPTDRLRPPPPPAIVPAVEPVPGVTVIAPPVPEPIVTELLPLVVMPDKKVHRPLTVGVPENVPANEPPLDAVNAPLAPSVVNAPVPGVVAPKETPFSVPPVKAMLEPSRRLEPRCCAAPHVLTVERRGMVAPEVPRGVVAALVTARPPRVRVEKAPVPPVIATAAAFCVAMVPSPEISPATGCPVVKMPFVPRPVKN